MSVCQFRFRQQPLFAQATVASSRGNEYVVYGKIGKEFNCFDGSRFSGVFADDSSVVGH